MIKRNNKQIKINLMKKNLIFLLVAIVLTLSSYSLIAQVYVVNNQGDTLMSILEDGNVGIGTVTPLRMLEVYLDTNAPHAMFVNNPNVGPNARSQVFLKNGNVIAIAAAADTLDAAFYGTLTDHDIRFTTHDTAKMIITKGGNVGIGTLSPDEKLHIRGRIKVREMDSGSMTDSVVTWNTADSTLRMMDINRISAGASPVSYSIGDIAHGGIVFYVNTEGTHGLVAARRDQMVNTTWYNALDNLNNPNNHNSEGAKYSDWRLPSKYELNLMYNNLHKSTSSVGGFSGNFYWSSTERANDAAAIQNFSTGNQTDNSKSSACFVRTVRTF